MLNRRSETAPFSDLLIFSIKSDKPGKIERKYLILLGLADVGKVKQPDEQSRNPELVSYAPSPHKAVHPKYLALVPEKPKVAAEEISKE